MTTTFLTNDYVDLTEEDKQRWRKTIMVLLPILAQYDGSKPIVLYGAYGCGKTTAVQLIRELEQAQGNLVVDWTPEADVVSSLMRSVSVCVIGEVIRRIKNARLGNQPPLVLDEGVKALLLWLLCLYFYNEDLSLARDWFKRHLNILDTSQYETFMREGKTVAPARALALLHHLVVALGYEEVVCFTDHMNEAAIVHLHTWSQDPTLLDHFGVRVVNGVQEEFMDSFRVNPRIHRIHLEWQWNVLWQICSNLLNVALNTTVEIPDTLKIALQDFIVEELGQTPRAMRQLALTLYWLYQKKQSLPLDLDLIKRDLFQRTIKICFDPDQQLVFRGIRPLGRLKNRELDIFRYLYKNYNNTMLKDEICEIFKISDQHLQQIIRRIRQLIEPKFEHKERNKWIYLHNDHGDGYRLCI